MTRGRLPRGLRPHVSSGQFAFTGDPGALAAVEAIFICAPTPLDEHRGPEPSAVVSSARSVASNLGSGALVVLENATYPSTTCEVVLPVIEEMGTE